MRILMVCLGNICRSPLAEGILKAKVQASSLDWEIDSAGTSNWHTNNPPDERSVQIAHKFGIDISGQRARQFTAADFDYYDLILAMDSSNYTNIKKIASESQMKKVDLILNHLYPGRNMKVPDPYYDNNFQEVYELLDKACDKIIELRSTL